MKRTTLAAAVVGLCSPLLLACSHTDPVSDPTVPPLVSDVSAPPVTSTPPTTPTAPTGPPTPVIPPAAQEKSLVGARAFTRFYIDVLNSAWHIPSGTLARRYSAPTCVSCRGIASSTDQIAEGGGYSRGGDWTVTATSPVPLQAPDEPIIHTAVTIQAGVWKRTPSDHQRIIEEDKIYIDVHLLWSTGSWLVTSMAIA